MSARTLRFLAFPRAQSGARGSVREGNFVTRSLLPIAAACAVANAVRETLASLLAQPVRLQLTEPIVPDAASWRALTASGRFYRVCGPVCQAAIVLRAQDALALAAGAFGELPGGARPLSAVEEETLTRVAGALSGSLAHVCGPGIEPAERILDISGFVTYFELLVEGPMEARIGIALSRDPDAHPAKTLRANDLAGIEIELRVDLARGVLAAAAFLDLRPGAQVPMKTRIGDPGLLKAGAVSLARGECGALGDRAAFAVTAPT